MQFTIMMLKINRWKELPRSIPILMLYIYVPDVWGVVLEIPQFMHGLSRLTSLVLGQQHGYTENKLINIKSAVTIQSIAEHTHVHVFEQNINTLYFDSALSNLQNCLYCVFVYLWFSHMMRSPFLTVTGAYKSLGHRSCPGTRRGWCPGA